MSKTLKVLKFSDHVNLSSKCLLAMYPFAISYLNCLERDRNMVSKW